MSLIPALGAEDLTAIAARLRPRAGERLVESRFRVERAKVEEFARALLRERCSAVPLTFYEAARLQLHGPDWSEVLGVDPRRMLHGEQDILIHEPLVVGDELDVVTVLTAVDRRTGRRGGDMLLLTLTSIFASASGVSKVEAVRRILLTTGPPTGAPPPRSSSDKWDGARSLGCLELADVVRYAGASGDLNPIHYDRDLARARGAPDVFAQGMLGAGAIAEVARSVVSEDPRHLHFRFRDRIWLQRPLEVVWRCGQAGEPWTLLLRDDESDKVQATVSAAPPS